ncbi:lysine-rich coiled-coil protein 1 isoform X2 [Oxyura jamaicensis]|uniref:lysine-rich coiled-coil protein 1 isoform X2 n=1 Tax=Oxyura jamaicensis TaxID=8884 RepID=UPI0015A68BE9|nr:lysine-rich coiled-coil protein 1 isoform X2 [Oxyura jamaicensis]
MSCYLLYNLMGAFICQMRTWLKEDVLDEATRKDLFTDTFCKVCRAVLQSESQRMSHSEVDGSGEADKNKHCSLCKMTLSSPITALSHYLGKIHAKKLKQVSRDKVLMAAQSMQPVSALQKPSAEKPLLPSKAEEFASTSSTSLELNDTKYCRLCSVPFDDLFSAQQHYVGKKHRRNVARKKIMEELGDEALLAESRINDTLFSVVWRGPYTCRVCNIMLSSIETYQSHVQGKKHQIRATKVVSLVEKSKKTYDSFPDELTDCIQVPKATGLEQRTYLRRAEEEEFQNKDAEGGSDLSGVVSSTFKREEGCHSNIFSETQSPTITVEKRSPSWPSACEHALEKTRNFNCNVGYCTEEQASEVATNRDKSFRLSVAESKDYCKLEVDETFTSCYREQKLQIKHSEEEKCISEELKCKKEATTPKRKENSEDADFGKENERQKRMKFDIDLVNEKKSKLYKSKRLTENPAEKESRKHRKDKQKPQPDGKTEEELLWDEFVFGH